jgi:hypothetical protein
VSKIQKENTKNDKKAGAFVEKSIVFYIFAGRKNKYA